MEILHQLINFILHIDTHLLSLIQSYGAWTYLILFLIIFCETGLVVTPFLPGDSLIFAAGAIAANHQAQLHVHLLFCLLVAASILGNSVNYLVGKWTGDKIFQSNKFRWINRDYLTKTERFYATYGGKTIIIARFMPIIRTFAPFVAGIGSMGMGKFSLYNIAGAILWIGSLLYTSFLFGNLPIIKNHFSIIIIMVIIVSLAPAVIAAVRGLAKNKLPIVK